MATEQQAQLVTEINTQDSTGTTPVESSLGATQMPQTSQLASDNQQATINTGQPTTQDQSANQSSGNSSSPTDEGIMTKSERDDIRADLKKSFKDLGRIPYLLILPLINLIQEQYEKIPEERRKGLARISKDIKESGKSGIQKLKDWRARKDEKKEITEPKTTEESNNNTTQTITNPSIDNKQPTTTPTLTNLESDNSQSANPPSPNPVSATINVETDSGKNLKVTTTIIEEKKTAN